MENKEVEVIDIKSISPYTKIKVYWDDRPENYSKEAGSVMDKIYTLE